MEKRQASGRDVSENASLTQVARGDIPADTVFKNGGFLDVFQGCFVQGDVAIYGSEIAGISDPYSGKSEVDLDGDFLVPGFIDAHVHIESSLMVPAQFEQTVLPFGTTSVIWDPHEIANVWGKDGIQWALDCAEKLSLDAFVMVPSCVPSTSPELKLETSGASLNAKDIASFRDHKLVLGLAEMMNFPGLLGEEPDITTKMTDYSGLKRDGHCPGLSGHDLNAYAASGIHSCHESVTIAEAREKLSKGIHTLIREGSCAKDAHELLGIVNAYTSSVVSLCSDDRNPSDIYTEGHINFIVNLGLEKGLSPEDIFRVASFSTARTYGLFDRGAVAPGYLADLVRVRKRNKSWQAGFDVVAVYKGGELVEQKGRVAPTIKRLRQKNLNIKPVTPSRFHVPKGSSNQYRVIEVIPNQILTNELNESLVPTEGDVLADPRRDLLKISVLERHHGTQLGYVGFVKGFGLKKGAISTSINHDSHNIICVGTCNRDMAKAVNHLIQLDGGIVVYDEDKGFTSLALPFGGLMTDIEPAEVASRVNNLKAHAQNLGCSLSEPFLQLSFLALPVIPSLKITDQGLIKVGTISFCRPRCLTYITFTHF